jgi:hypothetical protein
VNNDPKKTFEGLPLGIGGLWMLASLVVGFDVDAMTLVAVHALMVFWITRDPIALPGGNWARRSE